MLTFANALLGDDAQQAVTPYSARSASTGLIRSDRLAGPQHDARPTATIIVTTPPSTIGSSGDAWYTILASSGAAANESATPIAAPTATSVATRDKTSWRTLPAVAPMATLMPI